MFIACWNYLWPQEVASLPGIFTLYIDKIITSVLLTKDAFAAYSLGSRELPFVGQIGGSVSNVLMPHLVKDMKENNDDEVSRRWSRSCEKSAIITYPIAGFSIWFALPIIQFLFSSRYNESSIPFAIFSAITFIRVIEFGSLAKVYGKTNIIMKSSFWSAGTMLILAFPMTYFFKVRGISFSVFLSVLVAAGYFLWEYKKFLKKPVSDFFPWKKLLIMAGASITSAVLAGLILGRVLNLAATTGILAHFMLNLKISPDIVA
jgi:O-antigen/teichoic acid export membrane protein